MNRNISIYLLALYVVLFLPGLVAGLDPQTALEKYIRHTWTTRDGLPQNTVHAIVQDKTGYLWLGTDQGLVRFDGHRFKTYNKENTPAIDANSIRSLLADQTGTLWIATYGGGLVSFKAGKFTNVDRQRIPNRYINHIINDNQDNLWMATTGSGVIRKKGDLYTSVNRAHGLSSNVVSKLLIDSKGKLWIGTDKGLNCLARRKVKVYTHREGMTGNLVTSLLEDRSGFLWVGTPNGLNVIRNPGFEAVEKEAFSVSRRFTGKSGLAGHVIRSLYQDRDGNIWVATDRGLSRIRSRARGVDRYSQANAVVETFDKAGGLPDNTLLSLHEDRWGNMWVGSVAGGLSVMREGKFDFFSENDGLSNGYAKTIFQDSKGTVWIGTNGGGLNRKQGHEFTSFTRESGLVSDFVESITEDANGNLWIGTANGLSRFKDGKFENYNTDNGLSSNAIRTLFTDSKGNLWIGTFGGGLNLYQNGKFLHYNTGNGLSDNFVLALNEDRYGNLWIGTASGLNSFDGGLFRHFSGKAGVPEGMILDIYPDEAGTIWIATNSEGLMQYKDGKFQGFEKSLGMTGNPIYRILEDEDQNLWLSTNSGIYSVPKRRLKPESGVQFRLFQEDDGLDTSVCSGGSQPAGWKTRDGKIWFPTISGVAVMDLKRNVFTVDELSLVPDLAPLPKEEGFSYVTVMRPQPVIIEKIEADGRTLELRSHLELEPGTEVIGFYFIALNYNMPGTTLYKYRLEGYDKRWRVGRSNKAVYLNVPAGEYEFKVYARNSDGKWSYEGDSYSLSIRYSFFKTFWFYALLTLVISILALLVPRLREKESTSELMDKVKYSRSSLSQVKSRSHLNRLVQIMNERKPHLDPAMSLSTLAGMLDISKEDLSQVINQQLDKNFKHFLNEYRIEEAKLKLVDPKENQFVLLKIAFDVGFNSKSAFNASFKKVTGISPSQYRKQHQGMENSR